MSYVAVTLFDQPEQARKGVNVLEQNGFNRSDIECIESDPENQSFFKRLFSTGGGEEEEAERTDEYLKGLGIDEEDADDYADKVKKGHSLVIAQCESNQEAQRARKVLDEYPFGEQQQEGQRSEAKTRPDEGLGAERAGQPKQPGGETGHRVTADDEEPMTGRSSGERREQKMSATGEELDIDKEQVETGGIRAEKEVRETPVEEDIELREEHVDVERRKVDRPAQGGDEGTFEEETVEVSETREEPKVRKETRVKEEVSIGKDVETHTETIRETLREEHINIKDMAQGADDRFSNQETNYRSHYDENLSGTEYGFDDYSRGYRYGMALAQDENLRDYDWETIEPEAGRQWEEQETGSWDKFKEAVRFGWHQIRGEGDYEQRPSQR